MNNIQKLCDSLMRIENYIANPSGRPQRELTGSLDEAKRSAVALGNMINPHVEGKCGCGATALADINVIMAGESIGHKPVCFLCLRKIGDTLTELGFIMEEEQ